MYAGELNGCCGMLVIESLSSNLKGFLNAYENQCSGENDDYYGGYGDDAKFSSFGIVVFTDVLKGTTSHGRFLQKALVKGGYGTVRKTGPKINPVHGTKVELFVWTPSRQYLAQLKKKLAKKG